ncbi:hypothetical protein C0J52_01124, partial [Blattella germanica]
DWTTKLLLENPLTGLSNDVKEAESKFIPDKSRKRHLKEYESFHEWRKIKKVKNVCEDIVLAYLYEKVRMILYGPFYVSADLLVLIIFDVGMLH